MLSRRGRTLAHRLGLLLEANMHGSMGARYRGARAIGGRALSGGARYRGGERSVRRHASKSARFPAAMLLHQIPRRLTQLEERWHNPPVEHIFHKCVAPAQAQVTFLVLAFANAFGYGLIASRARSLARNKRAISAFNRVGGSLLISAGLATAAIRGAQNCPDSCRNGMRGIEKRNAIATDSIVIRRGNAANGRSLPTTVVVTRSIRGCRGVSDRV
jgi:hypothetical protein